jgi:hypothetical protein
VPTGPETDAADAGVTGLDLGGAASWVTEVVRRAGERGRQVRVRVSARESLAPDAPAAFSRFQYADFEGLVSADDALVLRSRRGAVRVAPDGQTLTVTGDDTASMADWPELHFALVEALRRQGLCQLHAAAAARGDECLVIMGPSGAGKTTALLQLLRAGWDLVADDSLFLYRAADGGRLECVGWPDPVRVTPWLAAHSPELRGRLEADGDKQLVAPAAGPEARRAWAAPGALWLLAPGDRALPSRVWPLAGSEAFCTLVPLSPLLMTARGHVATHTDMLTALLRQARVYGAALGEDLLRSGRAEALWAAAREDGVCA